MFSAGNVHAFDDQPLRVKRAVYQRKADPNLEQDRPFEEQWLLILEHVQILK